MTSPYDNDPDGAQLRRLLDAATGSMHAGAGLAQRAVAAHRRRQRRLVAVTAAVAALAIGSGTSLVVRLTGSHHDQSVLATNNASPSPIATPTDLHDVCGARQQDETSIAPTGGSPYLSSPPPARGNNLPIAREAALRAVRNSGFTDVLTGATLTLSEVRSPGPTGTCVTSEDWVVYNHPDSVAGGGPHVCVAYVLIDAHTGHVSGETTQCTNPPPTDCSARYLPPSTGGGPAFYGPAYRKLPATTGRWTKLPNGPLSTRIEPVVVWAGNQLIVWGGQSGPSGRTLHRDGASYDPATRQWTMLPPAPISPRVNAAAVWTGTELVIWGGYDNLDTPNSMHVTNTGASYDPATRSWRVMSKSPLSPVTSPGIAWTGSEVVIVDGQPAVMTNTVRGKRQAAAWDPATGRWHTLPREPAGTPSEFNVTVAHWTYNRLLVFHSYGVTNDPAATTVDSYDPATNSWTHLRKCDGAGYIGAAYDLNGQVLTAPFGDAQPYLYSPQHNTWTPTAPVPLSADLSAPTPDGRLLIVTGALEGYDIKPGDAALWDPRSNTWAKPPRLPVNAGYQALAVNAGTSVLLWTGVDGARLYAFTP